MTALGVGLDYFDLDFLGTPGVIACGLIHGADGVALVDPGPSTTLPALKKALSNRGFGPKDVRAILITHIHLDHAGATGVLAAEYTDAVVHVHASGARHMADPSKLLVSAGRLYGADMERLWGEVRPVPADRLRPIEVQAGTPSEESRLNILGHEVRVAHTPGHASHHVSYFLPAARLAFVGDTAGLCRESGRLVIPATPPPDIDFDAWRASTRRILSWDTEQLFVTHFGPRPAPRVHMQHLWQRLDEWTARVQASLAVEATDEERAARFAAQAVDDIVRTASRSEADGYQRAGRFDFSWMGLARMLRARRR